MRNARRSLQRRLGFGLIGSLMLLTIPLSTEAGKTSAGRLVAPSIKLTLVPHDGEGEDSFGMIGGTVSGVDFSKCAVVIYSHTDAWYVQPTIKEPFTQIQDTGKWEAGIHLGHMYAALLVQSGYKPPLKTPILPQGHGQILAIVTAPPSK
jgi:hypothetical protein